MATAQHSAAGRSPLAPGHWSRKGRGGREEDLCAEPEESRAGCREAGGGVQRVWFWSVPRVRRTGPNMVSRNGRAEEACPHTEWPVHMSGIPRCCPVGEVTPAVLDSSLTYPRNSQGLCPANSSQVLQDRRPLLASEEPEALPVRKGCQEAA